MKQRTVVTNLRIPEDLWLYVKTAANEAGVSANEYIKQLMWEATGRQQLGLGWMKEKRRKKSTKSFWEIYNIMKKIPYKPMGASEDDKIIYGINE